MKFQQEVKMSTRKAQQFSRFTFSTILAVLVLLVTLLASAAAPVVSANLKNASIGQLLDSDGTLNTAAGFSGALDLRGWNVTLSR